MTINVSLDFDLCSDDKYKICHVFQYVDPDQQLSILENIGSRLTELLSNIDKKEKEDFFFIESLESIEERLSLEFLLENLCSAAGIDIGDILRTC